MSSTAAGITSDTECAGGDGPSSAVLGSTGQESTDSNTVSVVSTVSDTHVVYGCNAVTAERQNVKQSKKKTRIVKCLFTSIEGPGGSSTATQTGESSSMVGERLSISGNYEAGSDMWKG